MSESREFVKFTKQMKSDYTILAPDMLPIHFKLIIQVLKNYGYNIELLENKDPSIPETGLKYVHNDTCYPAILVIGQFLEAIKSGKYDPHKIALIMFQTGGGCRASNYIFLIRKALKKAGYSYVPVISFSLAGLEKHPGWKLTPSMIHRMFYAVLYADLLMLLSNQCTPYELNPGDTARTTEKLVEIITAQIEEKRIFSYSKTKKNFAKIVKEYDAIPRSSEKKIKVGIVGEIFVKYSPLGNNELEKFLQKEGAEVVLPGFLDFCLYSVYNGIIDNLLYGLNNKSKVIYDFVYKFLLKKQKDIIDIVKQNSNFEPPTPFDKVVEMRKGYIGIGAKMGEGWLLTAEMLELYAQGVKNIVCAQPFGCLPNHICGKGMMKPLKERNNDINIVAIDYDASASRVNQENRIKLMLSNAKRNYTKETHVIHEGEKTKEPVGV